MDKKMEAFKKEMEAKKNTEVKAEAEKLSNA